MLLFIRLLGLTKTFGKNWMRVDCGGLTGVEEGDKEGWLLGRSDRNWRLVKVMYCGMIGVEERDERWMKMNRYQLV